MINIALENLLTRGTAGSHRALCPSRSCANRRRAQPSKPARYTGRMPAKYLAPTRTKRNGSKRSGRKAICRLACRSRICSTAGRSKRHSRSRRGPRVQSGTARGLARGRTKTWPSQCSIATMSAQRAGDWGKRALGLDSKRASESRGCQKMKATAPISEVHLL